MAPLSIVLWVGKSGVDIAATFAIALVSIAPLLALLWSAARPRGATGAAT